jgi:hypothetical protein
MTRELAELIDNGTFNPDDEIAPTWSDLAEAYKVAQNV